MDPILSIIIPVYNVEKYISKCLNSILKQEGDYEIIVVDDGSPDYSGLICDEIAMSDARVNVYHKENGGVSTARNFGLSVARGKFVTFVDSDDYVSSNYIASIMEYIKHDYDLTMFNVYRKFKRGYEASKVVLDEGLYSRPIVTTAPFFANFLFCVGSPINKIYKADIIRNNKLKFDTSLTICEDMLFNLRYFECVDNLYYADTILYTYLFNTESATRVRKLSYIENNDVAYYAIKSYINIVQDKKFRNTYIDILHDTFLIRAVDEIERLMSQGVKKKDIRNTYLKTDSYKELINKKYDGRILRCQAKRLKLFIEGHFFRFKLQTFKLKVLKGMRLLKQKLKWLKKKIFKK